MQLPPEKKEQPLIFGPCLIVAKRQDGLRYATWYGGRPRPRRLCV